MSPQRGENPLYCKAKKNKLSSLSDQEIADFMASIEDEDDFEDLDDSVEDPDYHCDEILPEDNDVIDDCIKIIDSSLLINAVSLSLNASNSSLSSIGAEPLDSTQDKPISEDIPSTSKKQPETATTFKVKKRARSPLPIIEASGPQAVPSSGGFTGNSKYIKTFLSVKQSYILFGHYNRKQKTYDEIDCSQIIREYNAHMGGVDLMDSYMGRNGLKIKTQDMVTRIFYHLLDMSITNAFVLYRRVNGEKNQYSDNNENEKNMTMYEFRSSIAKELCASAEKRLAGRPSFAEEQTGSSIVGKRAAHPVDSIRFDKINHFPQWGSKKSCKMCKKSDTHTICTKCNVHLCFSKAKNCFTEYHLEA